MKAAVARVAVIVALAHAFGLGCAWLRGSARPAAYGADQAICEASAKTWAEYTPCCVDTARRYSRDSAFCYPSGSPSDAGDK